MFRADLIQPPLTSADALAGAAHVVYTLRHRPTM